MMFTFYKKHLLLIVIFACSQLMIGQTVSKTIEKEVPISSSGTFEVDNKYGTVTINGWDNESLKISMSVEVYGKMEDEALNLLERIQPEKVFDERGKGDSKIQ